MTSKKLLKIFVGIIVLGALVEHVILPYMASDGEFVHFDNLPDQTSPGMQREGIIKGTENPTRSPVASPQKKEEDNAALDIAAYPRTRLLAGKYEVRAMVASNDAQWTQGLSGAKSLAPGEGMWFVFNDDDQRDFWMPDMNFPIDIVFVDKNNIVLNVASNAQPETDLSHPKIFKSDGNARYVLEIPAGDAMRMNIRKGSMIKDVGVKDANTR